MQIIKIFKYLFIIFLKSRFCFLIITINNFSDNDNEYIVKNKIIIKLITIGGNTYASDNKHPFNLKFAIILEIEKPKTNVLQNNKKSIIGIPIIEIPKSQIKIIYPQLDNKQFIRLAL